jgi:hypothetical protein
MKTKILKPRNFILAYIAYECAALIAAASLLGGTANAQILDRISFKIPQRAVMARLPSAPGLTRLVVTSNAPFSVIASGAVGDFEVTVLKVGQINTTAFGANAQMPGPANYCASAVTPADSIIYAATQKTARAPGDILSQSVMVEIRYDESAAPKFAVKTEANSQGLVPAPACSSELG